MAEKGVEEQVLAMERLREKIDEATPLLLYLLLDGRSFIPI